MNIQKAVNKLTAYGVKTGLIEKEDIIYTVNSILIALGMDSAEYEVAEIEKLSDEISLEEADLSAYLEEVLKEIDDYAASNGLLENDRHFLINKLGFHNLSQSNLLQLKEKTKSLGFVLQLLFVFQLS